MVDITSLRARLARLRLGSELDDWEDQEVRDSEQAENESLAQEDAAEFAPKKKTKKASKDPYSEYTKNTGGKRKKTNKLTRSDQKRGSLYAGYGEYTKNTGGKRKKKNKLTRSDQKRP